MKTRILSLSLAAVAIISLLLHSAADKAQAAPVEYTFLTDSGFTGNVTVDTALSTGGTFEYDYNVNPAAVPAFTFDHPSNPNIVDNTDIVNDMFVETDAVGDLVHMFIDIDDTSSGFIFAPDMDFVGGTAYGVATGGSYGDEEILEWSIVGGGGDPEPYRLAFVTSSNPGPTQGTMAELNAFVTSKANNVPELAALGTAWSVLGATSSVSVYDNTDTEPGVDTSVPIYLTDGSLLAADYAALWDSGLWGDKFAINEYGDTEGGHSYVLTGLINSGGPVTASNPLDSSGPNVGGRDGGYRPWYSGGWNIGGYSGSDHLFAISDVIGGDAAAVPEPSTFVLAALGLLGLSVVARRRRKN